MVTFGGAALSAVVGFGFNLLLARGLGAHGAGVVLQAIAVFTIVMGVSRLGLDTTAVWMLPRLMAGDRSRVRPAMIGILVPAAIGAVLATSLWFALKGLLPGGEHHSEVYGVISIAMLFLPAATVMTVALAATRAFGGVVPFNAIGNVLVPLLRPLGLLLVLTLGGGIAAVTLSWALPWLVGALAAMVVLVRRARRLTRAAAGGWVPDAPLRKQIAMYSLPRTVMSGLEQTVIWLDVVLVGSMIGSTQAGVYGSASRFVTAGVIVSTALRIVVAPRFSALLAEKKHSSVEQLYSVTAQWILLFGGPLYILLAIFSPTVLGWLGPGFGSGASSLIALCAGSLMVMAAGNVQSLLLMSGNSFWGAANKVIVVAFNVVGNLILIPRVGIIGAAVTWAVSMLLDTVLAAVQVRRSTGISLAIRAIGYVFLVLTVCVALPAIVIAVAFGQGNVQLIVATALAGLLLMLYCVADRKRLHMRELVNLRRPEAVPSE